MYVASTVHKVMGDTVPMIATQITDFRKFKFWAKEQLYVLLSRVRDLSHFTFVGDRLATMRSIDNTLVKENHLLPFINSLLDRYTDMRSNLRSVETLSPFPLRFSEIPNTSFGFCYLLRSLKLPHLFYVGRCKNLRRRVHEHNSGHGSEFTKPIPRRP